MKKKVRILGCLLMSLVLLLSLTACTGDNNPTTAGDNTSAPTESISETEAGKTGLFNPGTYTAAAAGMNGDVTVEVVVSETAIESIDIIDHKETAGISDPAIKKIPENILQTQSLAVDAVAGATYTSKAILAAVEDCLTQAGADIEALNAKNAAEKSEDKELVTKEADVVIIGGGGAGMSAAVSAAKSGASVIVIEKTAILGGNTILAGGGFNAVDPEREQLQEITDQQLESIRTILAEEDKNELHAEMKAKLQEDFDAYVASGETYLFDSVELHALQSWAAGDYAAKLELIYELAKQSPATLQELEDMGLVWKDFTLTYVGALWPRSHEARDYKSGQAFIDIYLDAIETQGYDVEIMMEVEGKELVMTDGAVTGVRAEGDDGTPYELSAGKGVVIATGGFGANVEMREAYNTQWSTLGEEIKTSNSPAITGDGIVMAEAIGASLIDMNYIQLLPTCDPQSGAASGYIGQATSMYINKEGVRFVNELERRDVLVRAALEQTDSMFYLITNEENAYLDENNVNKFGQPLDYLLETGKVIKGDTIEELAENIGVDPAVLTETVDKFNEASTTGNDPEFGRNAFADNILLTAGGPYYAIPRQPAVHHTMGGVEIDTGAHVLDVDGNVIPGLYAAGEVTGGIHGTNRIGANAVPDALSFGRIAGTNAAAEQ